MRRNLYFYLYPVKDSVWPWHVERLRKYWGVWNGRKIVTIATDETTESESAVRRELDGLDCEISVTENDLALGEAKTFVGEIGKLESQRSDEITFYAHAKGVTRKPSEMANILAWSSAMYHMNLSDPGLIDRILERFEAVGCFRFAFQHAGSWWHFAGTYFWFRHSAIFSRAWRTISPGPHGVESYLGLHVPWDSAFCLTPSMAHTLYDRPVPHEDVLGWMKSHQEVWTPEAMKEART